jgi:hypothetical protein
MQFRPGTIAILAGGVLLLISTFLDWVGFGPVGFSVFEGDRFGLAGIFLLLISLAVTASTAIATFAPQVSLPEQLLGFSRNQIVLVLGFAAFVYGFSVTFAQNSEFGAILAWIAAAAIVVGAFLEEKAAPSADSGPPRTF